MTDTHRPFTDLPDLASRSLRGSVVWANDELFAGRENLIKPHPPRFAPDEFGDKGKVYDGWETRRRREPGVDQAIVRLGVPGQIAGVVIDTAWFLGNYPPFASVEGVELAGHPSAQDLLAANWSPVVPKTALRGDYRNELTAEPGQRVTHVRLSIYPDGGVARFRVHGRPLPDPEFMTGTVDLAAVLNGGDVVDCSDAFYSSPRQMLMPGLARSMGDGWENARRRGEGHDFVVVRLGARGVPRYVEIDTSYFVGNSPGWAAVRGRDGDGPWRDLVPRVALQPDTPHRFTVPGSRPATEVRLDVFPDGGVARLRVNAEVVSSG